MTLDKMSGHYSTTGMLESNKTQHISTNGVIHLFSVSVHPVLLSRNSGKRSVQIKWPLVLLLSTVYQDNPGFPVNSNDTRSIFLLKIPTDQLKIKNLTCGDKFYPGNNFSLHRSKTTRLEKYC